MTSWDGLFGFRVAVESNLPALLFDQTNGPAADESFAY
jgi:hypothetical protein